MPGKFYQNDPRLSPTYCEGRAAARAGKLVSDNPFADSGDDVSSLAWIDGFASWGLGAAKPRDCCADLPHQDLTPLPTLQGGQVMSQDSVVLIFSGCVKLTAQVTGSITTQVNGGTWAGVAGLQSPTVEGRAHWVTCSNHMYPGDVVLVKYDTGAPYPVNTVVTCQTGEDIGDQAAVTLDNPLH